MNLGYGQVRFAQGGASANQAFNATPAILAALNAAGLTTSLADGDVSVTPNAAQNSLDLVAVGPCDYLVTFLAEFTSTGAPTGKFTFTLYKDNVIVPQAYGSFSVFGTDGDFTAGFQVVLRILASDDANADGFVRLTVKGISNQGGGISCFPKSASLTAIRLR